MVSRCDYTPYHAVLYTHEEVMKLLREQEKNLRKSLTPPPAPKGYPAKGPWVVARWDNSLLTWKVVSAVHSDRPSAEDLAIRKATDNPGVQYRIFQAVMSVSVPTAKPKIERY